MLHFVFQRSGKKGHQLSEERGEVLGFENPRTNEIVAYVRKISKQSPKLETVQTIVTSQNAIKLKFNHKTKKFVFPGY